MPGAPGMTRLLDRPDFKSYTSHMETISISSLKTHLSSELKRVQRGMRLVVIDHHKPVAVIGPLPDSIPLARSAKKDYLVGPLKALSSIDPISLLATERDDRW